MAFKLPTYRDGYRDQIRRAIGGVSWAPLDLLPVFWGRSDLGVTVTGAGVSGWADQSGNGRDLAQGTDGNRPPLISADLNGHDVLRYSAGAKYLSFTPWAQPASCTIYCVGRCVSGTEQMLLNRSTSGPRPYLALPGTALRPGTRTGAAALATWGSDLTATQSYLVKFGWSGGSQHTIKVNDATEVSSSAAHTPSDFVTLGSGSVGCLWDLAEVLILDRLATTDEDAAMWAYSSARYGL